MRARGNTREARQNQARSLKAYTDRALASSNKRSAIGNQKHRSAYKNVTLPTVKLPPDRE
jgi:hypothetical protein